MAPWTPQAPRLSPHTTGPALHGELSRNSSSRGCWRLIPQRIYHQGLQGADSPCASAKLQPSAVGLQAPARARPGLRAAAISRQQLPGCMQDSPSESQHPTQSQSHHQGLPFGASWMLSANYIAHSSPLRAADRSWGENTCFSAAVEDPNGLFPQGALWSSARENCRGVPMGVFTAWTPELPA